MRTVEHHWNGRWGKLARRDVWLKIDDDDEWVVEARAGDGDSRTWRRTYVEESDARAMVDQLLARGAAEWRDLAG